MGLYELIALIHRNRDPTGMYWAHPTYKAAGLPTKIPVLALIHPDNPAVVYFFLDHHLFGVDLRDRTVVACDLYHLVNPPTDLVSTSFVHAWQLPKALHSPYAAGQGYIKLLEAVD
ncbi:uncharacterized protein C2845_PM07G40490 [Panicum miliaceum]|uniref:Uncharacterized protein n=1 Tax=Panicum miliaceum TaxID=4540 RepID=A0A3L6SNP2_PANMI|nr:uncharacterized protein C2845_PM07G40490 [Panicum miliaceum]